VAFIVLVPAFIITAKLGLKQAFWYHFAGGIVYNLIMYWWIYNVMKVGPALVIGMGLLLLILFLSLFNGILGWLFKVLSGRTYGLVAFPFLWAGMEVLRTRGEMSFPWNNMGYTLGQYLPFIQAASFLGIFGLSAIIVAGNVLAYFAWHSRGRVRLAYALLTVLIPMALFIQGNISLSRPNPAEEGNLDISLIQPSIPQTKKWDEHYFQDVMEKTWRTMEGSSGPSPILGTDLVVLAETAIPDFLRSRSDVYLKFQNAAKTSGTDFLIGALDFAPDPKPYHTYLFYNSAFLFTSLNQKDTVLQYSKLRLVPFSERLPFDDVFPIINYVNLGEGDFSPGQDYAVWKKGIAYSPSICYEIIYPDFARGARHRGAKLLVNITNDGWFGYSNAPFQHANIARFRAIEVGAPIARCSNAGISVFYDFKGRILGKTGLQEQTVLRRKLPIISRETWYLKHGDAVETSLLWIYLIGMTACSIAAIRKTWITKKRV
jgi:apolipoprotein N-acyltransferase